ncbi:MFS transporter [Actinophytocola sp.]|uniref:MFS transporter n=1 Tax=Actinophytocola sp. TaxID=1872138 RepID=UPI002D7E742C|nr:MFS transporter [Actinophytocola sp.]HET9142778.1 MFS transporter [Actinophytocola sp.]
MTTGYRSIATRPVLVWAAAALANQLPIAMAPVAFVFLARELPGGYPLGAALAMIWVLAEVTGAPVLGVLFRPDRARAHLALGLGLGAAAYAGLAFGASISLPALVALTFLAGFFPAASGAGLRALLTGLVPEPDVPKVLSAETVLKGVIWAAAPVLVAFLALGAGPGVPMALAAVLNLVAVVLIVAVLPVGRTAGPVSVAAGSRARTLAGAWPIYLSAAASMAMVATIELVLPALVESRGLPVGTVAPLLMAFWVSGVVGGYLYGRRPWPGRMRQQSLVCLLVTTGALTLVALLPGALGIGAALVVGGAFQSCVLVTRNLSLRDRLPVAAHTAGYAIIYATTGIGYSLVAAFSALVMTYFSPAAAIVGGGVITLAIIAASALSERERVILAR